MNVDPEGHAWWEWLVAAAVVVVCAVAAVATAGASLVVSAVLAGAVTTAGAVAFSKGFGPRTGHNQHERQMWNEAKRLRNIEDKDLAQRIHHKLKKYPYAETLNDLLNVIDDILAGFGKR